MKYEDLEYMTQDEIDEMDKKFNDMISSMTFDQLIHEIELFALVDQDSKDFKEELRRRIDGRN